jgi:hypothetical protein
MRLASEMYVSDRTLIGANIGATVLHSLLLATLLTSYVIRRPDRTSVFLLEETGFNSDADRCNCWPRQGYETTTSSVDIFWMTVAFTSITAIAHAFYSANVSNVYIAAVDSGKNPYRWVEYGGSASTMLVILAIISGVRNRSMFVVLFVMTFAQMLQGYMVEAAVANNGSVADKLIPLLAGWALSVSWYVIYSRWYSELGNSDKIFEYCIENDEDYVQNLKGENGEDDKTGKPPGFIKQLINVVFILFSSFGIVNLVYVIHSFIGDAPGSYRKYELAFIILSFVAKATLIIWCMSSVFYGDLLWLRNPGCADSVQCMSSTGVYWPEL